MPVPLLITNKMTQLEFCCFTSLLEAREEREGRTYLVKAIYDLYLYRIDDIVVYNDHNNLSRDPTKIICSFNSINQPIGGDEDNRVREISLS